MAPHLETARGWATASGYRGPPWEAELESDSGSGSGPVESPHEHIVVVVAAAVSASVAVVGAVGVVLWHRQQTRQTVRQQSGLPNYDFMVRAARERRMGSCRRVLLSLFGLFVVTSEFTATALLLWFGTQLSAAGTLTALWSRAIMCRARFLGVVLGLAAHTTSIGHAHFSRYLGVFSVVLCTVDPSLVDRRLLLQGMHIVVFTFDHATVHSPAGTTADRRLAAFVWDSPGAKSHRLLAG